MVKFIQIPWQLQDPPFFFSEEWRSKQKEYVNTLMFKVSQWRALSLQVIY